MDMPTNMSDPRWAELAALFCESTGFREGEKLLLEADGPESFPFVIALYEEALRRGALAVDYEIVIPQLKHYFLMNANRSQLEYFPKSELVRMQDADVYMMIQARTGDCVKGSIPDVRSALRNRILEPIDQELYYGNTRWCVTRVPTEYDAQCAGMDMLRYMDHYFQAVLCDYEIMKSRNNALKDLMNKTDVVTITANETDLRFSISGIGSVSCYGDRNIPAGEVFTAPIRDSVSGLIHYNAPSYYCNREWSNVRFEFQNGKIVSATCDQGDEAIRTVLDTDEGARFIGEFAIGTNPGIRHPTMNTLFDEKIFGSFHLTPGSAYPEADNGNYSVIHWDLVKTLTPECGGGTIRFDGVDVIVDGEFVHPKLRQFNIG